MNKVDSVTYKIITGCGELYLTITGTGSRTELFVTIGKAGGCAKAQSEAIGRMISLALSLGALPADVSKQLKGISCHSPAGVEQERVLSCADGIAQVVSEHFSQ